MSRAILISLGLFIISLVLIVGLALYWQRVDLTDYREQIASYLSEAVGHQVAIEGLVDLHLSAHPRLVVEHLKVENLDWQPDQNLVSFEHLSITVDLLSILQGPLRIDSVKLKGLNIHLATNAESRSNWQTAEIELNTDTSAPYDFNQLVFQQVQMQDVQLILTDPAYPQAIRLSLDFLSVIPNDKGMLNLELSGLINELPLAAGGELGPWQNLTEGRDLTADIELTLGELARLNMVGSIADLQALAGIEMQLGLSGATIERITDAMGVPRFADGAFQAEISIQPSPNSNWVSVKGNLGKIDLSAAGELDNFSEPQHARLGFSASGPDTRHLAEVFGISGLPAAAFSASGDLALAENRLQLTGSKIRVGQNHVDVDGWVHLDQPNTNLDMRLSATGPDFSIIGPLIKMENIPQKPFQVSGRFRKLDAIWEFDDTEVSIGENRVNLNGAIDPIADDNSLINFSAAGPDVSFFNFLLGEDTLPARPYRISALIKPDPAGVRLAQTTGYLGDNRIDLDGILSTASDFAGTDLTIGVGGPDLAELAALVNADSLPTGPYSADTRVRIDNGTLFIEDGQAVAGSLAAAAGGTIDLSTKEFSLDLTLKGQDLTELANVKPLSRLAGEHFSFSGNVAQRANEIKLTAIKANVGNLNISINGSLGIQGQHAKLVLEASAPDSAILGKLVSLDQLPSGELSLSSEVEFSASHVKLSDTDLHLGAIALTANGTLSNSPQSNNSDLELSISGPELRVVGLLFGITSLPPKAFQVSGKATGIPVGFGVEKLRARVGDSDIHGDITVDLRSKPIITGILTSAHMDLTNPLGFRDNPPTKTEPKNGKFVFPQQALKLDWLNYADVNLTAQIDRLDTPYGNFQEFRIVLSLLDGLLDIDPISFRQSQGKLDARFHLESMEGQHQVIFSLNAEKARLGLLTAGDQDQESIPSLDGQVEFNSSGVSLHDLMASSNGKITFYQGSGRLQGSINSRLVGDIVAQVVDILNPLHKRAPYTNFQCGIYAFNITNGIAKIETLAAQTDKVKFISTGHVNFVDESLNLTLQVTPRKGLGISVTTVTNSFLKLGGTLKNPRLNIDPTTSVTATGAAIATGGLSILAQGLWDRVAADKSICREPNPTPSNKQ